MSLTLASLLRWLVTLLTGVVIGIASYLAIERANVAAYSFLLTAAGAGIAFSLVLFLLLQSIRVALRSRLRHVASGATGSFIQSVAQRHFSTNLSAEQAASIAARISSVAEVWILGISTFALLGLVVTLAGTLVLLGQTVAAYQQVGRLDRQNTLLQQQLDEGKASTARAAFSAHLDPLTESVTAASAARAKSPDDLAEIRKTSMRLRTRISAVLATTIPYQARDEVEHLLSPERGQLLSMLLSAGLELGLDRYDFSYSDFTGMVIVPETRNGFLRATALRMPYAFLAGAELGQVRLEAADLRGAVLPRAQSFIVAPELKLQGLAPGATLAGGRTIGDETPGAIPGANMSGAVVESQTWLTEVRDRLGGENVEFSLWRTGSSKVKGGWKLEIDPASAALSTLIAHNDQHVICKGTKPDPEFDAKLREFVALINAQKLDEFRPHSKEKGQLILLSDSAKCLQDAGASFRDAYLGFVGRAGVLVLDDLDVSHATFRGGYYRGVQAHRAALPSADEFKDLILPPVSGALRIEGARVPTADWLRRLAARMMVYTENDARGPLLLGAYCLRSTSASDICDDLGKLSVVMDPDHKGSFKVLLRD